MYWNNYLPSNALEWKEGEEGGGEREEGRDGGDGSGSGPFPDRGPESKSQRRKESPRRLSKLSPNLQSAPHEKMSSSTLEDADSECELC
jgi:hypothetical protein